MNEERDLLPWVFGGLSAAAIAVAFAAVSTHRDAPNSPARVVAAQPTAPTTLPAPVIAQAPASAAEPGSAPVPAPAPFKQTALAPQKPAGQIWQCTTQGVRTFSSNPCGEKSTLLDVGPVNTMTSIPTTHYAGAYGTPPRYSAAYSDQSAQPEADVYPDEYSDQNSDQNSADAGENSFAIVGLARRRPERVHRPSSQHSHRKPAPVRRD